MHRTNEGTTMNPYTLALGLALTGEARAEEQKE